MAATVLSARKQKNFDLSVQMSMSYAGDEAAVVGLADEQLHLMHTK
jgi:hypothetical protein